MVKSNGAKDSLVVKFLQDDWKNVGHLFQLIDSVEDFENQFVRIDPGSISILLSVDPLDTTPVVINDNQLL